ncbi:hypothetical protein LMH87_001747 [Akanthomyces muscarius]|uniref:BZIP domain-containing protein n=1 Tax=Akanthomyces muscarius TaxID=2231603 RepID=A0A9W8Q5S3_AKAMU|nr:hypothetical protein LMH87_001747 [Akanthomyces muscarius]KAJ4147207.1 hypothetical protein LMH87_001747 [Akanthomyces muscarius]
METAQESLTERRRRQNRLNQQARRKRLADEANAKGPAQKWIIYSASAAQEAGGARTSEKHAHLCQRVASDRNRSLEKLRKAVAHNFLQQSLNAEALVSVTRYNIYQAMLVNATYLGLTMELLREDIISPFNVIGPATFGFGAGDLPPSLRPTALQRQIVHHPWVDLCPMPSLRDALLLGAAVYDEDELCHDLFIGAGNGSEHQAGLVVWGESWDPTAYELSEAILEKWQWLLAGCTDVLESTNSWRAKRCARPLRLGFRTEAKLPEAM